VYTKNFNFTDHTDFKIKFDFKTLKLKEIEFKPYCKVIVGY